MAGTYVDMQTRIADDLVDTAVTTAQIKAAIQHSFGQFAEPTMLLASFTTLFLIGWILADSRMRTQSLWLPIGLHSGWIFTSVFFNKIAQRETLALPWLGKSLLIGIVPLGVGLLTWLLVIQWSKHARSRDH